MDLLVIDRLLLRVRLCISIGKAPGTTAAAAAAAAGILNPTMMIDASPIRAEAEARRLLLRGKTHGQALSYHTLFAWLLWAWSARAVAVAAAAVAGCCPAACQ